MGRDMLSQDYLLKQLSASLTSPENTLGRKFWDRVYSEIEKKFGHVQVPVNTFNKIWIIPDKAGVYFNGKTAFVVENHLKVMLEEDYLAIANKQLNVKVRQSKIGEISTEGRTPQGDNLTQNVLREIILPAIEHEVNRGKNFAIVRQIFNSMILAIWFKNNLKETQLNKNYADQNKINGIDLEDTNVKEEIYHQYLVSVKKGAYNLIKEAPSANGKMLPRKYFSGGIVSPAQVTDVKTFSVDWAQRFAQVDHAIVTVQMQDAAEHPIMLLAQERTLNFIDSLALKARRPADRPIVELSKIWNLQFNYPEIIEWIFGYNKSFEDFMSSDDSIALLMDDNIIKRRINQQKRRLAQLESLSDKTPEILEEIGWIEGRVRDPRLFFVGIRNYREFLISQGDQEKNKLGQGLQRDLIRRVAINGFDVLQKDEFFQKYLQKERELDRNNLSRWLNDQEDIWARAHSTQAAIHQYSQEQEELRLKELGEKVIRNNKDDDSFLSILWRLRRYWQMSQAEVANNFGISSPQIAVFESGKEFISNERYEQFFRIYRLDTNPFGITPEMFLNAYREYLTARGKSYENLPVGVNAAMTAKARKRIVSAFSRAVNRYRDRTGVSLHVLLGVSETTLKAYKSGRAYPTREVVLKLEDILGKKKLTLWKEVFKEIVLSEKRRKQTIANLIWQLRVYLGLKQYEFVNKIGVEDLSVSYFSLIESKSLDERKKRFPNEAIIEAILNNSDLILGLAELGVTGNLFEDIYNQARQGRSPSLGVKRRLREASQRDGGIDFNPSLYEVKSKGQNVYLDMANAQPDARVITGLRPVIIGVVDASDSTRLLN